MSFLTLDLLFFQRLLRLFRILFGKFSSKASVVFYILASVSLLRKYLFLAPVKT